MKKLSALILILALLLGCMQAALAYYEPVEAVAMEKLATRSGPGTRFRDTGSFDVRGETVKILCRAYDHNDVCWVECEVRAKNGKLARVYTGLKRFDPDTFDWWEIDEEMGIFHQTRATRTVKARFGPGEEYDVYDKLTVDRNQRISVVKLEGDWAEVEWTTSKRSYRAWVERDVLKEDLWD